MDEIEFADDADAAAPDEAAESASSSVAEDAQDASAAASEDEPEDTEVNAAEPQEEAAAAVTARNAARSSADAAGESVSPNTSPAHYRIATDSEAEAASLAEAADEEPEECEEADLEDDAALSVGSSSSSEILYNRARKPPALVEMEGKIDDMLNVARMDLIPFGTSEGMAAPSNVLAELDDSVLLSLPATFVSHVLSTVGNAGHQVLDGRTTSLSGMVIHTFERKRQADSLVVGKAKGVDNFTTLFKYSETPGFFGDVPTISALSSSEMRPAKTSGIQLAAIAGMTAKQKRLLKSIAIISLLMRPDVAGDAEAAAEFYSKLRGVSADTLLRCAASTSLLSADLQEIFLGSDKVKPQLLASTAVRRSIAVAAAPGGHVAFGNDVLIDYQRTRVAAAAAFRNSCDLEGVPWNVATASPGSVVEWTPESGTIHFRIYPGSQKRFTAAFFAIKGLEIPGGSFYGPLTDLEVDLIESCFSVKTALFEPYKREVLSKVAPMPTAAELNAVVDACSEVQRKALGLSATARVTGVKYVVGVALDAFVSQAAEHSNAVMAWIRSIELSGVLLARARTVSPTLPWALALVTAASLFSLAKTFFEVFLRTADESDIAMSDVLDTVMAHIPSRLPIQLHGHAGLHGRFMCGVTFYLIRHTTDRPAELTYVRGLRPHQLYDGKPDGNLGWQFSSRFQMPEEGEKTVRVVSVRPKGRLPEDDSMYYEIDWLVALDETYSAEGLRSERTKVDRIKDTERKNRKALIQESLAEQLGSSEARRAAEDLGYVFLNHSRTPYYEHKSNGIYRPRSGPPPDLTQTTPGRIARRLSLKIRNLFGSTTLGTFRMSIGATLGEVLDNATTSTVAKTKSFLQTAYSSRAMVFRTAADNMVKGPARAALIIAAATAIFLRNCLRAISVKVYKPPKNIAKVAITAGVWDLPDMDLVAAKDAVEILMNNENRVGVAVLVPVVALELVATELTKLVATIGTIKIPKADDTHPGLTAMVPTDAARATIVAKLMGDSSLGAQIADSSEVMRVAAATTGTVSSASADVAGTGDGNEDVATDLVESYYARGKAGGKGKGKPEGAAKGKDKMSSKSATSSKAKAKPKMVWTQVQKMAGADVRTQLRKAELSANTAITTQLTRMTAALGRATTGCLQPKEMYSAILHDSKQIMAAVASALGDVLEKQRTKGFGAEVGAPASHAASAEARKKIRENTPVGRVSEKGDLSSAQSGTQLSEKVRDPNIFSTANAEAISGSAVNFDASAFDGVTSHTFGALAKYAESLPADHPALVNRPEPYGLAARSFLVTVVTECEENADLEQFLEVMQWPKWSMAVEAVMKFMDQLEGLGEAAASSSSVANAIAQRAASITAIKTATHALSHTNR